LEKSSNTDIARELRVASEKKKEQCLYANVGSFGNLTRICKCKIPNSSYRSRIIIKG